MMDAHPGDGAARGRQGGATGREGRGPQATATRSGKTPYLLLAAAFVVLVAYWARNQAAGITASFEELAVWTLGLAALTGAAITTLVKEGNHRLKVYELDEAAAGEVNTASDPDFENDYKNAADRYENIYKAIWQIFSFLAIVAAAFVSLSGKQFDPYATTVIVMAPLVFWFIAIYIPMDHYGHQVRAYLRRLEKARSPADSTGKRRQHYTGFVGVAPPWHVRSAVYSFAVLASLVFFFSLVTAIDHYHHPPKKGTGAYELNLTGDTVIVRSPQADSLRTELDSITGRVARMDSAVQRILCLQQEAWGAQQGGGRPASAC